jgi:hypothetical protein
METDYMVATETKPNPPKTKLSLKQKCLITSLLCLQIPSSALFYPVAAVIILTGVGAPLSMLLCVIGTKPLSQAMKLKATWQAQNR